MACLDCCSSTGAYVAAFLRAVLGNEKAEGMNVTIHDPDLDEDGAISSRLADLPLPVATVSAAGVEVHESDVTRIMPGTGHTREGVGP